ncbi:MAG: SAM-dependent methyltransferase [Acidimicrobiia bacterium]
MSAGPTLKARLIDRIQSGGPIPFEEFMEAALYDPADGFFSTGPLRSAAGGDFLTSPEVSSLFGATLARFCAAEWHRVGDPFTVLDAGAGSGSLLAPLLKAMEIRPAAFAVEVSAAARARLVNIVGPSGVLGSLGELPGPLRGVIVANELVDNLPTAIAMRSADGWVERRVGRSNTGLEMVSRPARKAVVEWCESYAGHVSQGALVEVQLAAAAWMGSALSAVEAGAVVVVDYGGTAEELQPRRRGGTLRTYREHHLGPDPLLEPGATDITADVNFTALMAAAEAAGAEVELHRQDDFLKNWGLRDVLAAIREEELAAARGQDPIAQLRLRSSRTDAEALLHPRGLGDFRVMVARA